MSQKASATASMIGLWFEGVAQSETDRPLIVVFPFAVGSARHFVPLRALTEETCDLVIAQLPGRDRRSHEPPIADMEVLVGHLTSALTPLITRRRYILMGHSLGALVAFALTLSLLEQRLPEPTRLIVSACGAPHLRDTSAQAHRLEDKRLAKVLESYDGIPAALLESEDFLDYLLPVFRADLALFETWACPRPRALPVPVSVLFGRDDQATSRSQVDGWRAWTHDDCVFIPFPGGHFFINEARAEVARILVSAVAD